MLLELLKETSFLTIEDIIGKSAYTFFKRAYGNRLHPLGMPFFDYALGVAEILRVVGTDAATITAALLHLLPSITSITLDGTEKEFDSEILNHVLEDMAKTFDSEVLNHVLEDAAKTFDSEILNLVKETLYLSTFEWNILATDIACRELPERSEILKKMYILTIDDFKTSDQVISSSRARNRFQESEKQIENVIRMLLALTTDIRALIIRLAGRLHLTRLLNCNPNARQQLQKEALDFVKINLSIYGPLANRLGIWRLKSDLDDASFQYLEPDKYKFIEEIFQRHIRERPIKNIIRTVQKKLYESERDVEVYGREKYIYSIYQKMVEKQLDFEQINDLLGIRIIVGTEENCYKVQNILHQNWEPVRSFYDGEVGRDWIATPKENGYQSLHTTIRIRDKIVEVQIRTKEMHEVADYGPAASHWRYKENKTYEQGNKPSAVKRKDQVWSNELAGLKKKILTDAEDSANPMFFSKDRVYVITPKGHVIDLKAHAILLDFAYRVHTELGHTYAVAKVNGCSVSFNYMLTNGEIVELLISSAEAIPNPIWLVKDGQYLSARTPQARRKIRSWSKAQKDKNTK
jgi:guanosine-3',5'-bis(diphosphate) 3'-pyrophosphohydrolase